MFAYSKLSYSYDDSQLLLENNNQLFEITSEGEVVKHISLPNNLSDFSKEEKRKLQEL